MSGSLQTEGWAVAVTAPRAETLVCEGLIRLERPYHLFKTRVREIRNHHLVEEDRPAFPRYVFVEIVNDIWRRILDIRGVVDFIRFGEVPEFVSPIEMGKLLKRTDISGCIDLGAKPKASDEFEPGEKLRLISSTIGGDIDVVYQMPSSRPKRCVVWVHMFGQVSSAEVNVSDLRQVESIQRVRGKRGGSRHHQ